MHPKVILVCDTTGTLAAHHVICNAVDTFWCQQLGARCCLASRSSLVIARKCTLRIRKNKKIISSCCLAFKPVQLDADLRGALCTHEGKLHSSNEHQLNLACYRGAFWIWHG